MDTLKKAFERSHRALTSLPLEEPPASKLRTGIFFQKYDVTRQKLFTSIEHMYGFASWDESALRLLTPNSWGTRLNDDYDYRGLFLDREAILTLKAWHVMG